VRSVTSMGHLEIPGQDEGVSVSAGVGRGRKVPYLPGDASFL
jgi:hypothetical protein